MSYKKSSVYGDWLIEYNPKPIPSREFDYDYWHTDYDGPDDPRCGNGPSVEKCFELIDEIEEDLNERSSY